MVDVDMGVVVVEVDLIETMLTMRTPSATWELLVVKVPLKTEKVENPLKGVTMGGLVLLSAAAVVASVMEKQGMGTAPVGHLNVVVGLVVGQYRVSNVSS